MCLVILPSRSSQVRVLRVSCQLLLSLLLIVNDRILNVPSESAVHPILSNYFVISNNLVVVLDKLCLLRSFLILFWVNCFTGQ